MLLAWDKYLLVQHNFLSIFTSKVQINLEWFFWFNNTSEKLQADFVDTGQEFLPCGKRLFTVGNLKVDSNENGKTSYFRLFCQVFKVWGVGWLQGLSLYSSENNRFNQKIRLLHSRLEFSLVFNTCNCNFAGDVRENGGDSGWAGERRRGTGNSLHLPEPAHPQLRGL